MRDHRVGAGLPCPLWVKSGHSGNSKQCPLYPRKRTSELNRADAILTLSPNPEAAIYLQAKLTCQLGE